MVNSTKGEKRRLLYDLNANKINLYVSWLPRVFIVKVKLPSSYLAGGSTRDGSPCSPPLQEENLEEGGAERGRNT